MASAIILFSQSFWVVAASQVATAIAGAAIGPAVAGMTLGITRQAGFNRQVGRNQAFNHAGNMVGAGLSGLLGWAFGFPAVLVLAALFGILSIASVLMIPKQAIDDRVARGLGDDDQEKVGAWRVLLECKPLLMLAAALALFHLGNAAMLPLYGLAVVAEQHANGPGFVATTIVVAQGVMIVASIAAMRMAEKEGYWLVLLISFLALPIRGVIAASVIEPWGVFPVQALDGIGAGLQSVAVPGLVARILNGTGRVNVGQGAVMTMQGLGAALSPAIGGWIAQRLGYPAAFLILGGIALGSIAIWLGFAPLLKARLRRQAGGRRRRARPCSRRPEIVCQPVDTQQPHLVHRRRSHAGRDRPPVRRCRNSSGPCWARRRSWRWGCCRGATRSPPPARARMSTCSWAA